MILNRILYVARWPFAVVAAVSSFLPLLFCAVMLADHEPLEAWGDFFRGLFWEWPRA